MCQQHIVAAKLRSLGISHVRSFFDVSNAFPSESLASLESTVDGIATVVDRPLWRQRLGEATVRIETGEGFADYRPRSGALQGDGPSAQLFLEPFHPVLDRWDSQCQQLDGGRALYATCFVYREQETNLAMSTYADDISRVKLCSSATACVDKISRINSSLDEELDTITLAQNKSKQEHVVWFGGKHSKENNKAMYQSERLPGTTSLAAKYLGGWQHFKGQVQDEVDSRVISAQRCWMRMGFFWSRGTEGRRGKLLVYTSLVYNTLLSGLEALVLRDCHEKLLDSKVLGHGRKLMRGQACKKEQLDDGTLRYTAHHSNVVWKWLGLVPARIELRVRRLRWYQSLAKDIWAHRAVVSAILGDLRIETDKSIPSTVDENGRVQDGGNAWAEQFKNDIMGLEAIDAGQQLLEYVGDRVALVFTEFRDDFLAIDVSAIRGTFLPNQISPPGWEPPDLPTDDVGDEAQEMPEAARTYVCDCTLADGRECGQTFTSNSALSLHKTCMRGGTHGTLSPVARVTVANICPWCRHIYQSKASAKEHIRRTLRVGRCTGAGSTVVYKVAVPRELRCPTCDGVFASLDALLAHVVTHVQLPNPQGHQEVI